MSREHAVDPSTLDPETWVEVRDWRYSDDGTDAIRVKSLAHWPTHGIVAVLRRADECPPAEQWRQVTPEEVREGWLVERRERWTWGPDVIKPPTSSLWTNEPADPDAENWAVYEHAIGRVWKCSPATQANAEREASLAGDGHEALPTAQARAMANAWATGRHHGLRIVEVDRAD